MKIFLSFLQSKVNYPIPDYKFWYNYMSNAIIESELELIENNELDWARGLFLNSGEEFDTWKEKIWTDTVDFISKNRPQLFISYLYPKMIDVSAVKAISDIGIPCVNFYCDNIRHFREVPDEFKYFDLNWVPEFDALEIYQSNAVKSINLPMPMWVPKHLRDDSKEINKDVSFIGSMDIARDKFIVNLRDQFDIQLKVYGGERKFVEEHNILKLPSLNRQFQYIKQMGFNAFVNKVKNRFSHSDIELYKNQFLELYNGKLSAEEYISVTRESMVTIGINRYYDESKSKTKISKYSKLRDIEAPMLGACYLTEKTRGIENLYDVDREVLVYSTEAECFEQIQRLKNDKELRQKIRRNGATRALNDHTIIKSVKSIISQLGI